MKKEIKKLKIEVEMLKSIISVIDDYLGDTHLSNKITRIENNYKEQLLQENKPTNNQ